MITPSQIAMYENVEVKTSGRRIISSAEHGAVISKSIG